MIRKRTVAGMTIERIATSALREDPANARRHPAANLSAIRGSLGRFGQVLPLVVRHETNIVIGGNGTLRCLRDLGIEETLIVRFRGTDQEAAALALALNRSAELAQWDSDALRRTIDELAREEVDLKSIGFSPDDLAELVKDCMTDESAPPATPEIDERSTADHPPSGMMKTCQILVICRDRDDQHALLNDLRRRGYECRPHRDPSARR